MPSKHAFTDLVKHCLAEVIVETSEVKRVVSPTRKNASFESLVKKCVVDVLKEGLTTPPPIREALTPKAVAVIQKWQQQLGDNRKVAVKLVDYALSRKIGLTSSDLADTTTFSGGLDMIEQHLEDGNYQGAFDVAKDTADEMIADEGGAGMDEGTSGNSLVLTPTGQTDEWSRPVYTDQAGRDYVDINLGNGELAIHSITDDGEPDVPIRNYTIGQGQNVKRPKRLCPRCGNSKPEWMTRTPDGKQKCTSCHWVENPGEPAIAEGFDPLSQGPNPDCKENPYPEWNAHMRSLEEAADEDPLYVEYHSDRQGEIPFVWQGQKWQFVNAKYPDGKIDIGVYSFGQDLVIAYNVFQRWLGQIKENHLQSEQTLTEDAGKWLKKLVIAGLLSWAALTSDGRNAVKQAYHALQIKSAVPQQVQQQIQDEVPYTGAELDQFIQSQIDHRDKIDKEIGPVSKKIFQSKAFFRDEEPTVKESDPHGRYAQEAGAGQFDPRTFGVN